MIRKKYNFDTIYQSILQETALMTGSIELLPNTSIKDLRSAKQLKVYRSSARPNKNDYTAGSHCGTKQQALIRADYMINDEGKYDKYYLYELTLNVSRVYPSLLADDGSDHGYDYVQELGKGIYDIAFYKNTGEGDVRKENLSVIIINPSIVIESKMVKILDSKYLMSIQRELY